MNTKLYLTVAAIVAILYALAFLVIPVQASLFFGDSLRKRTVALYSSALVGSGCEELCRNSVLHTGRVA